MTADTPLLAAEGLHLPFGPTTALDGASLTVAAGEPVAVTGPSGSGKWRRVPGLSVLWQTLLPMALGLLLAAAGGR